MRIPLSWLKEFINDLPPTKELSDLLTLAGLEVDKIAPLPLSFTEVVVARVESCAPHPQADSLQVAEVFDGSERLQIVCGAPNCRKGLRTALAKVGAQLGRNEEKPFKIKKSKIRSIASFGMLCSKKELGLGEEEEGILELGEEAQVGTPLEALYGDTLLEISLTPNLGHCMSVLGIARELSALLEKPLHTPQIAPCEGKREAPSVTLIDKTLCPHYSCQAVDGVEAAPSPDWLKKRLESCGIRSINALVDVTNYVMMEQGQPLHAFDADKVEGEQLIIKKTESPLTFETLDGEVREVPQDTLMIWDSKKPLAIAGIMGGASSAISSTTKRIILESAHFDPATIRRGSKALGLRTESSARFERGVDPEGVERALKRARALIQELVGGSCSKLQSAKSALPAKAPITLRANAVNGLLGTTLSQSAIARYLKRLDIELLSEGEELTLRPPSYRNDLHSACDLIEEVARLYGYNTIKREKRRVSNSSLPHSPNYLMERSARGILSTLGLQEFLTCDLISPKLAALCFEKGLGEKEEISVLHPSSVQQSLLRLSLLPGLLQAIKHNFDRKNRDISAFEVGKIHFKDGKQFKERTAAALILTGHQTPPHWSGASKEVDLFFLKGKIEQFLTALRLPPPSFQPTALNSFHPGKQAAILLGNEQVGVLGELHPTPLQHLDLKEPIFFAQIDCTALTSLQKGAQQMKPLPTYPGSDRDWTVTLPQSLPCASLFEAINNFKSKALQEWTLIDRYVGEKVGKGSHNLTFRFTYRDPNRTLSHSQVEKEHQRLIDHLTQRW